MDNDYDFHGETFDTLKLILFNVTDDYDFHGETFDTLKLIQFNVTDFSSDAGREKHSLQRNGVWSSHCSYIKKIERKQMNSAPAILLVSLQL